MYLFGVRVLFAVMAVAILLRQAALASDATYTYTVQLTALAQESPPKIILSWPQDPYGAQSYTVYRKAQADNSWGTALAVLPGTTTTFTDANVSVGSPWEYQVSKVGKAGYNGYGYIFAGIRAPLIEARGTLVLCVEQSAAAALGPELNQLQSDLVGDGWQVSPVIIASNASPATLRSAIANIYYADPGRVKAVFLFGHVPILHSGQLDYDGHLVRAMPADAYYGDMDIAWPMDPALSPDFIPSDIELMVGRVDLADMPGQGAQGPWPPEMELLRNYLNKDHKWRHKQITVNRRALVGNLRGDEGGEATAASGFRNFSTFVGPENTFESNVSYEAPVNELWVSMLESGSYLWAYACGAGLPNGVSGMGTNTYNFVLSTDIRATDIQTVFCMMFGSWFGNWDGTDNFMRSVLATPTMGLTACMAGRPHWYLHHMALGEPIGYGTRLAMNNSTLYQNQTNAYARAVYVGLMGDPTLRMDQTAPISNLNATAAAQTVSLNWSPSPDASAGYYVYRSVSAGGPFARITPGLLSGTTFLDDNAPAGQVCYMVRAVSLEQHYSGSYYNPSQGIFIAVDVGQPPIVIQGSWQFSGFRVEWSSLSGAIYRVQMTPDLKTWGTVSETVAGTGGFVGWTDTNAQRTGTRFYQVIRQP